MGDTATMRTAAVQMIVTDQAVRDAAVDILTFTWQEMDRQLAEHIKDSGLSATEPPVHEREPLWDSGDPEVGLVGWDLAEGYGCVQDKPDAWALRATQLADVKET